MKFFLFYLLALLASTLYLSFILREMTKNDCIAGIKTACEYIDQTNKQTKEF